MYAVPREYTVDRDGYVVNMRSVGSPILPTVPPLDLEFARERPYWLYCTAGSDEYWVGDQRFGHFITDYTSDVGKRLMRGSMACLQTSLGISDARLQAVAEGIVRISTMAVTKPVPPPSPPVSAKSATITPAVPVAPVSSPEPPHPQPAQVATASVRTSSHYTLASIAPTLTDEQDDIMRDPPQGISLVSGVAGSGKTNVAFHRVDFLIKQHGTDFHLPNMAYFAPSPALASYITHLRDSLGFAGMHVYDYRSWSDSIAYSRAGLTSGSEEGSDETLTAKSSVAFAHLVHRYVEQRIETLRGLLSSEGILATYGPAMNVAVSADVTSVPVLFARVRDAVLAVAGGVAEEVDAAERSKRRALMATLEKMASGATTVTDLAKLLSTAHNAFDTIRDCLHPLLTLDSIVASHNGQSGKLQPRRSWLSLLWPAARRIEGLESAVSALGEAVASDKTLRQRTNRKLRETQTKAVRALALAFNVAFFVEFPVEKGSSLVKSDRFTPIFNGLQLLSDFYASASTACGMTISATTSPTPTSATRVSPQDLDVAVSLVVCMTVAPHGASGVDLEGRFDHVIADEAEEFSAMQMATLNHMHNNSMTVAGDTTQRSLEGRISDWSALGLNIASERNHELHTSFRTTLQIALFANCLLKQDTTAVLPQHVAAQGDKPLVVECDCWSTAMAQAVQRIVEIKKATPAASIVVIHPQNAPTKEILGAIKSAGISAYIAHKTHWEFSDVVTVTTYGRLAGLEYEHVIVLGLNSLENESHRGDKNRILYSVVTRAVRTCTIVLEGASTTIGTVDPDFYEIRYISSSSQPAEVTLPSDQVQRKRSPGSSAL
jgi:hypothetical protein